jgi:hypothetical protein
MFTGPRVTIRVGDTPDNEFHVSKEIICSQSPYFAKLLTADHLTENLEIVVTVAEIEGIVSFKNMKTLIQWLYRGTVEFGYSTPEEEISEILEFTRLAHMFGILQDVEKAMASRIREIILTALVGNSVKSNHPHLDILKPVEHNYGILATHIRIEHTHTASELPRECGVRKVLAAASVEGYLRNFPPVPWHGLGDTSSFTVDLMQQVKLALMTLQKAPPEGVGVIGYFRDPIIESS